MQKKRSADDLRLRELAMPLLGKWVPFILILLSERPYHFAELEREMIGVSRKVLNENLNNLQGSGIVAKEGESSTGFPVYYSLTELGKSSLFILENIKSWLREHEETLVNHRKAFDRKER